MTKNGRCIVATNHGSFQLPLIFLCGILSESRPAPAPLVAACPFRRWFSDGLKSSAVDQAINLAQSASTHAQRAPQVHIRNRGERTVCSAGTLASIV